MYKIIQNANGGLFLLYTRHNPGDVLNLLLDGNDIGLTCRVESLLISITDIAKLLNNEKTAINIIFRRLNKRIYDEMVIG